MNSRKYILGDLITVKHGFAFSGEFFSDEPSFPSLVTPGNFKIGGGFVESKPKTFTGEIPSDYILEPGDVIVTMTDLSKGGDTLGYSAKVPNEGTYLHNQRIGKVINLRPNLVSLSYIYWFMRTNGYRNSILSSASGTAVRHTSPSRILEVEIRLPHLVVQNAIANLLDLLELKIQQNERIATLLEQLASSFFKSWFIDFDPVKAKMAGEEPFGMDAETTALFPDAMEESELGDIPSAWRVRKLGDLALTLLGGTPSRKRESYWGGNVPWINSGKINDFRVTSPSEYITELGLEKSTTKLLPKGTCAIAITGATLGQFTRLEIESCANQSVVGVLESEAISNEFIYLLFAQQIDRLVSAQTGGAQQHINKNDVNDFLLVCPPEDVMAEFTRIVRPFFDTISLKVFENESLRALRDGLLPRLISGELEIPDEMLAA